MPSARPHPWRRRLYTLSTLYLIPILLSFGCGVTDRVLLHPSRDPIPTNARRHSIAMPNGGELEVWRSYPKRPTTRPAVVLEFTGNASRAEAIADDAAVVWDEIASEVWVVNYPGFGGSTGPASMSGVATSALVAYDALRAHAGADAPIFISGRSMGSVAALHVAARRPTAGLLLMNPPALRQIILGRYGWWNLWLIAGPIALGVPSELDSVANARRANVPAIIIASARDEVVPHRYQQMIVDAHAGPKRLLRRERAGHNGPLDRQEEAWLAEQVRWLRDNAAR